MMELLYGLLTGICFGFFLQKGRVLRYDKQLAALRLQDMTIVKFMLSHIAVAMVGVYWLYDLGLVKLSVKPTILGGVIIGGLLFGLGGFALLALCMLTCRTSFRRVIFAMPSLSQRPPRWL